MKDNTEENKIVTNYKEENKIVSNLAEAIRNNFFSLCLVLYTTDGFEVTDISTKENIATFWRPFDAKDYGVASTHVNYRSEDLDEAMQEKVYQAVSMYYFS